MKILCHLILLFVTTCSLFSLVFAIEELSNFVTKTYLDNIKVGRNGDVSETNILKAFVKANPNLPAPLKVTSQRDRIIYVSGKTQTWAYVEVHGVTGYSGLVKVTYNGGPPTTEVSDLDLGAGGNNWRSRFNLSLLTNLVTSLGRLNNNDDETIKRAFKTKNEHKGLPLGLFEVLKVRAKTRNSARLYVPEGNSDYVGEVYVAFTL